MMIPSERKGYLWKMIFSDGECVHFGEANDFEHDDEELHFKTIRDPGFMSYIILNAESVVMGYLVYMRMSTYFT